MRRPASAGSRPTNSLSTAHYPPSAPATAKPRAAVNTISTVPTIHANPITKLGVGDRGQALVGPGRSV